MVSEGRREQKEAAQQITVLSSACSNQSLKRSIFPKANIWFVEYSMSRLAFLYTSSLSAHTFTQTCMSLEACACVCVLWCFGVGGNRRNALTGGMFVISCPPCSFLLLHTHTHTRSNTPGCTCTYAQRCRHHDGRDQQCVCVCVSVRSQERFDKDRERPE